jgi:hypothetical protein
LKPRSIFWMIAHHTHFSVLLCKKTQMKSMLLSEKTAGSLGGPDGHLLPPKARKSATSEGGLMAICSPASPPAGRRALLDGNLARKKLPPQDEEYVIWDTELPGFGLRVRPSGRRVWFVRVRQRGTQRRIALGAAEDVDAVSARKEARRLLGAVAVDGLPKKEAVKAAPTMREFDSSSLSLDVRSRAGLR